MAKYLFTGGYSAEGAQGVLAMGGAARRDATERFITSLGGTVESYYFAFGSDDFYLTVDMPDHAAAAAAALTASASGAIQVRTTVLITPEELDAAARLSPDYRAPGT